jgi:hypothetical protein
VVGFCCGSCIMLVLFPALSVAWWGLYLGSTLLPLHLLPCARLIGLLFVPAIMSMSGLYLSHLLLSSTWQDSTMHVCCISQEQESCMF